MEKNINKRKNKQSKINIIKNKLNWFAKIINEYFEIQAKNLELESISGYRIDEIINLFHEGYTLQKEVKCITLYACDVNKNEKCKKRNCYINGGPCEKTSQEKNVKYINLDDYIPKEAIREKIEKKKEYSKLAEEQLKENETIIIDTDSLNFGREEAHKLDIEILKELLGE